MSGGEPRSRWSGFYLDKESPDNSVQGIFALTSTMLGAIIFLAVNWNAEFGWKYAIQLLGAGGFLGLMAGTFLGGLFLLFRNLRRPRSGG